MIPVKKLWKVPDSDIQHESATLHAETEIDQSLEGQGGDVGFAPLALLCIQVLLVLDPPGQSSHVIPKMASYFDQC